MNDTVRESTDADVMYMINELLDDPTNGFNNYWSKGETNTENETLGKAWDYAKTERHSKKDSIGLRTKDLIALGNDDITELLKYTKVGVLKVARGTEVPAVAANLTVATASLDDNEEEDEDEIYGGLFSKMN